MCVVFADPVHAGGNEDGEEINVIRHAGAGRHPVDHRSFWIPASAGMTQ